MALLGFLENPYDPLLLGVSALHTWTLGMKFGQEYTASLNAPPKTLKVKF
jgi:hypothetical protein